MTSPPSTTAATNSEQEEESPLVSLLNSTSRRTKRGGVRGSSSGSGGEGGEPWTVLAIVLGIFSLIAIIIGFIGACHFMRREAERKEAEERFPDRVIEAKARYDGNEQLTTMGGDEGTTSVQQEPASSGEYDVVYSDSRSAPRAEGVALLSFTDLNDGRGYKISGKYIDKDGEESRIKQGFVRLDGSRDAFWVDEYVSGNDIGMKVLNEGLFDFQLNKFEGRWYSSTGYQGEFKHFDLKADNCDAADEKPHQTLVDYNYTPLSPLKTNG